MGLMIKDLTFEQLQPLLTPDCVVVLPIGGGSKEHGNHLPMGTDLFVTDWVAAQVTERCDVLTLPTLPYGHFPAFVDWKGTVSITHRHFVDFVQDILESYIRCGVKKFLIIDGGVSTHPPLRMMARELDTAYGAKVAVSDVIELIAEVEQEVCQQKKGGHADESETSMMLYIREDLVHMDKTTEEYTRTFPGCMVNGHLKISMPGKMVTPTGSNGNSKLATREKGEKILTAMVDGICEFLNSFVPWKVEEVK